jgi:hypothetical protein
MLWEIWGGHKAGFFWQGVTLGAGLCFAQWKRHGVSELLAVELTIASLSAFICFPVSPMWRWTRPK